MRIIDVTASSKELAIEKGLQMLGTTEENVNIVVLEKGSMLKKTKIEITFFENEQEKLEFIQEKENSKQKETENNNINIIFNEVREEQKIERTELTDLEKSVLNNMVEFVYEICKKANVECSVEGKAYNENLYVIISGQNTGKLIGYHGEALEALQILINTIVRNQFEDYSKKIFVDIEAYKERRKETVESLAKKMAIKVVKEKRSLKLEPMNSYERKIIHSILQNIDHISTHSEGTEPNRFLVIDYVK